MTKFCSQAEREWEQGRQWREGNRKWAFFANHINAHLSGFAHLSIFWVGPRSSQFCLRDLGDSIENLYISLTHQGQNKVAGGSTDFNKTDFSDMTSTRQNVLLLTSLSHHSTPNRSKLCVTCFSPKIPELEQILCLYEEKMTLPLLLRSCFSHVAVAKHTTRFPPYTHSSPMALRGWEGFTLLQSR